MIKKLLIIAVLLLCGVGIYFATKQNTSFNQQLEIAVADTASIQKLFLVDMQGNKIVLTRKNKTEWLLNNEMLAREDGVSAIFSVLYQIKAAQEVPHAKHNSVINELSVKGTKVEAFDAKNNLLTSFTIGSVGDKDNGNYALKKGATKPYIYSVKNFVGDFSLSFFTKTDDWRNRKIIDYPADSIANIHLQYAEFADSSFTINNKNNELEMLLHNGKSFACSHTKVKTYIKEFNNRYCLNFETQLLQTDSIRFKGYPYAQLSVVTKAGIADTIVFVRFKANQKAKDTKLINGIVFDQEYLYAFRKKDVMVVSTQHFAKIFTIPSFFSL
jgi:Domain of unknown function (DUF4340)